MRLHPTRGYDGLIKKGNSVSGSAQVCVLGGRSIPGCERGWKSGRITGGSRRRGRVVERKKEGQPLEPEREKRHFWSVLLWV